jgi:hypothetical protein
MTSKTPKRAANGSSIKSRPKVARFTAAEFRRRYEQSLREIPPGHVNAKYLRALADVELSSFVKSLAKRDRSADALWLRDHLMQSAPIIQGGAGRPAKGYVPLGTVRVPAETAALIRAQAQSGETIGETIARLLGS